MPASSFSVSPVLQRPPIQATTSSSQLQLLNALGLRGVGAITYLCKYQQPGYRPTVDALLRQLPIEGMNT